MWMVPLRLSSTASEPRPVGDRDPFPRSARVELGERAEERGHFPETRA